MLAADFANAVLGARTVLLGMPSAPGAGRAPALCGSGYYLWQDFWWESRRKRLRGSTDRKMICEFGSGRYRRVFTADNGLDRLWKRWPIKECEAVVWVETSPIGWRSYCGIYIKECSSGVLT
jgi:hypothetical protein